MPLTSQSVHRNAWSRLFFLLVGLAAPIVLRSQELGTEHFWLRYLLFFGPACVYGVLHLRLALAPPEAKNAVYRFVKLPGRLSAELTGGVLGALLLAYSLLQLVAPAPLLATSSLPPLLAYVAGLALLQLGLQGDVVLDLEQRTVTVHGFLFPTKIPMGQIDGVAEVRRLRHGVHHSSMVGLTILNRKDPLKLPGTISLKSGIEARLRQVRHLLNSNDSSQQLQAARELDLVNASLGNA